MNRDHSVRELLPDHAAGRLDARIAQRVATHVAGCETCAAELEVLRTLAAARIKAPARLEARLRDAVRAEMAVLESATPSPEIRLAGGRRGWSWLLSPWTGAVAAMLIAAVAGTLVLFDGATPGDSDVLALGESAPYGTLPGADGELAGLAVLDDLSEAQLEELLVELER